MTLLLSSKQRLVLIGDSITDAGRGRPVGTFTNGLGEGYPSLVNSLLTAIYPELEIEVLNVGSSGDTVRHLKVRWQTDVIDLKPDWLSIMIGTNDVWRQFDSPEDPTAAVLEDEFTTTLNALVVQTKPLVTGLILLTPFLVETNLSDPFRARMDQYNAIVKAIGGANNVPVVDTQAAFDRATKYVDTTVLAPDHVHPTQPGHVVLAKCLLDALSFEW